MNNLNITNVIIPENYFGFVYKTIFPDGIIYVGETEKRIHENYFGSGSKCKKQIIEFGKDNLKREILCFCNNKRHLDLRETIFIKKFNAANDLIGYNISKTSTYSSKGTKRSDDAIKRTALSNTGKKRNEETKRKISLSRKGTGMKHSEETKRKISTSQIGKIIPEDIKNKMSLAKKGKKLSNEHRKNISIAYKNMSEDYKRIISNKKSIAGKNRKLTDEHKRKIGLKSKGRKHSIETKLLMSSIKKNKNE